MTNDFGRAGDGLGLPFVAGSVTGHRFFQWNKNSRTLTSPIQRDVVWEPGEQIAECKFSIHRARMYQVLKAGEKMLPGNGRLQAYACEIDSDRDVYLVKWRENARYVLTGNPYADELMIKKATHWLPESGPGFEWSPTSFPDELRDPLFFDHRIVRVHGTAHISFASIHREMEEMEKKVGGSHIGVCCCGFYAYYGGCPNEHLLFDMTPRALFGVIEGYGETVLGSKGFRSSKAKILGIAPVDGWGRVGYSRDSNEFRTEFAEYYPNVPVFDTELELRKEIRLTEARDVVP